MEGKKVAGKSVCSKGEEKMEQQESEAIANSKEGRGKIIFFSIP